LYAASPTSIFYTLDKGEKWHPMSINWKGLPAGVDETAFIKFNLVNAQTKDGLIYLKTKKGILKSIDHGSIWYF
jgi:hypothetical protein